MATTAPVIEPHVESLDIAELVAHPANRELVADDLVDLTESLSSKLGLLQYPVVVPLDDGGHRIIVGHSRIMSAQQLGWTVTSGTASCCGGGSVGFIRSLVSLPPVIPRSAYLSSLPLRRVDTRGQERMVSRAWHP